MRAPEDGVYIDKAELIGERSLSELVFPVSATRRMFTDLDLNNAPTFSTREVSTLFFQRSPDWLRWRERQGYFKAPVEPAAPKPLNADLVDEFINHANVGIAALDDVVAMLGESEEVLLDLPVNDQDVNPARNELGTKRYSYLDIEKLAHNLCAHGAIHVTRLMIALAILRLSAIGAGALDPRREDYLLDEMDEDWSAPPPYYGSGVSDLAPETSLESVEQ